MIGPINNVEEAGQMHCRPDNNEGCSTFTPNIDEKTCETSTDHPSMGETDISSNKVIDRIGDNQCQDQEHVEKIPNEDDRDTTLVTNNDLTKNGSACSMCKTRRPNNEWKKEFTYEELEAATDGFSLKNCLSESGNPFSTFKGKVEGEMKIVVKQNEITNTQVREKMKSEIQTIGEARHNNVVMLLGSSTKDHFMLIVYEYACNGSLDIYLSSKT